MLPQKTRMISRIVELKLEEAEIYSKSLLDVEKIDINANHELVVELRTNVGSRVCLKRWQRRLWVCTAHCQARRVESKMMTIEL